MCILNLWQTLEEDSELHHESGHGFIVLLDPQEQAAFVSPRKIDSVEAEEQHTYKLEQASKKTTPPCKTALWTRSLPV